MFLRLVHIVTCINSLLLFIAEEHSIVWAPHSVRIYVHVEMHAVWGVMNKAATKMRAPVSS